MNASAHRHPLNSSSSANQAVVATVVLTEVLTGALTKAVTRAADRLGVTRHQLSSVLGLSQSTISRVYKGEYLLDDRRKEWELALLFVRVFRIA
jgi:DNA-binding XRE family transcriptional regulator